MDSAVEVVISLKPARTVVGKVSTIAPTAIEEFRGIPYGTVPGRWKHSILKDDLPAERFDATKNGPQCPQPDQFANSQTYQSHLPWPVDVGESEFECLNLFIVRPRPEALRKAGLSYEDNALPVYAIIHGGGFGFGAGTDPMWDPTRLLMKGLANGKPFIAVVINYRLGIFGFGYSGEIATLQTDPDQPKGGNFGLGDQRTALRWISRHISAFGGNPSKVTIAGQSAGAVSVQIHAMEAKYGTRPPLFRRAIQQSGGMGSLRPISLDEMQENWQKMYESLGVMAVPTHTRLEVLMSLSAKDLLAAAGKAGWIIFAPVADDLTILKLAAGGWWADFGKMDPTSEPPQPEAEPTVILLGDCAEEGMLGNQLQHIHALEDLTSRIKKTCPHLSPSVANEIWAAYNLNPLSPPAAVRKSVLCFATDSQFAYPVDMARAEFSSKATQMMRPVDGQLPRPTETRSFRFNTGNPFPGKNHGVAHHCVDLIYIYDCFHDALADVDCSEAASELSVAPMASNASLVSAVQSLWIDFIVNDTVEGNEEVCTTFETDRTAHERIMEEDMDWVAQRKRFAVLAKHREAARLILMGLSSHM